MSDDGQWRDKYRDALSRLSAEEARRSRLQSVLRLLIGRLCLAGQGRDARLDAELLRVAETVRKGIDPKALEELLEPLSQAVTVLDLQPANQAAAPEPPPASGSRSRQHSVAPRSAGAPAGTAADDRAAACRWLPAPSRLRILRACSSA